MRIINILSANERKLFDSPPVFTLEKQQKYFLLDKELLQWLKTITPINQVVFVLMLGYARATTRFYSVLNFPQNDLAFVIKKLKHNNSKVNLQNYQQRMANYYKSKIKTLLGIKSFDVTTAAYITDFIMSQSARATAPKEIFIEVVNQLRQQKIECPSYNRLATIISTEIVNFETKLFGSTTNILTDAQKTKLDDLIRFENGAYVITRLKTINQERTPAAINASVADYCILQNTSRYLAESLSKLNIHKDTIRNYATWVRKASLFQIEQLSHARKYLYLLCFVEHQYLLRQDTLADIVLLSVRNSHNLVSGEEKEAAVKHLSLYQDSFNLLTTSRKSYKELVHKIKSVADSKSLSATDKITEITELIESYHAQQEGEATTDQQLETVNNEIDTNNYYNILMSVSQKLQNRVANIMRHLSFEKNNTEIYKAIEYYQSKGGNVTKSSPATFMTIEEQNNLEDNSNKFLVSLYKILFFMHVAEALKSGIISLMPSYRYLSLESYLISSERWQRDKIKLLTEANLLDMQDLSKVLARLKLKFNKQLKITNKNISSGQNEHVKFDNKNKVIISTPKVDKPNLRPLAIVFNKCKYVPILRVLHDIQKVTNYLGCLRHLSVKDKQALPDENMFYAAIISLGCNIGTNKMASVSRGINKDILANLINWHISLDNINAANEVIIGLMDKLAIARINQKSSEKLHTSSDGRKISVSVSSLNANSSYKYFGSGIGIVNYSFIDELNRAFYATAISSAEKEAAYVIDGLLHNPAVESTIHSTDTHGYSEVMFCATDCIKVEFAPRIKGVKHATLYGFSPKRIYEAKGYKIHPSKNINEKVIEAEWDNILRLMATIILHESSASQIFKRLSSYAKQHPLYCAMKEYGRIIKSIFILRYIDDVELRQSIQKQLNRIELSNKFANAISFDNDHEIQYGTKEEQDIAINCQRLIQNIIVLWNELYLSEQLLSAESEEERTQLINEINNGSTQLWAHINFLGEYDFTSNQFSDTPFDIEKILALNL